MESPRQGAKGRLVPVMDASSGAQEIPTTQVLPVSSAKELGKLICTGLSEPFLDGLRQRNELVVEMLDLSPWLIGNQKAVEASYQALSAYLREAACSSKLIQLGLNSEIVLLRATEGQLLRAYEAEELVLRSSAEPLTASCFLAEVVYFGEALVALVKLVRELRSAGFNGLVELHCCVDGWSCLGGESKGLAVSTVASHLKLNNSNWLWLGNVLIFCMCLLSM